MQLHGSPWDESGFSTLESQGDPPDERGWDLHLAVVLAITNDPSADVARYLDAANLSMRAVLLIKASSGPSDTAVEGAGHATAIAQEIVVSTRATVTELGAARVHLFAAAPSGVMLFLGHRWNRVVTTTTYEDLGARGYLPAFVVEG